MRVLLVNPNMSAEMTARLAATARRWAPPEVELVPLTATRGFPYISSRAEAQVAGVVALEMIAASVAEADAVVIAAFGDPGLRAARELFDLPVVGMAEAAIHTATMLGDRFGVVTFTPRMTPWYRDAVVDAGRADRFTGFRTPAAAVGRVEEVGRTMRDELHALVRAAAEEDGADVVILGGAPLAGLAYDLAGSSPVTLVDPISAAVLQAASLARLAPRGASRGAYARPPGKRGVGLDRRLAEWMAGGGSP